MATKLFEKAKPPACFAPEIRAEELDDVAAVLARVETVILKGWSVDPQDMQSHPEIAERARAILRDKTGKFDDLSRAIATEFLTGAEKCSRELIRQVLDMLSHCVGKFLETPESEEPGEDRPTNLMINSTHVARVQLTPLADAEVERMWDEVPWYEELEMASLAISCIPSGVEEYETETGRRKNRVVDQDTYELANRSQQLLWYCRELYLDREPSTQERLLQQVTSV